MLNSKSLIAIFFLTFLLSNVHSKTIVISDIDDTLKDAQVLNKIEMAKKAYNIRLVFPGMNNLFQELEASLQSRGESYKFFYVSNAPDFLMQKAHDKFIRINHFPAGSVLLRAKLSESEYKIKAIEQLIIKERPDTVIMIGDNGERDAEIYEKVSTKLFVKYGVEKSFQFIRKTYTSAQGGKQISEGQIFFVSAGEIATVLYLNDQLGKIEAENSINALMYKFDGDLYLEQPAWIDCSDHHSILNELNQDLRGLNVSDLKNAVNSRCSKYPRGND